jgi:hypothetical protein
MYLEHHRVKARNVHNFRRRLRERWQEYWAGEISFAEFDASVQSWINQMRYADTWGSRRHILWQPLKRPKKSSAARQPVPEVVRWLPAIPRRLAVHVLA